MLTAGSRVTLVRIDDSGELVPESSAVAPFAMPRESISSWVFAGQTRAHLLRLSDSRFVLLGAASQVFDVVAGQLQPSNVVRLGPEVMPRGAVSRDNRYWACTENGIYALKVEGTPPISIPVGGYITSSCQALALSADGSSMFAATHRGLLQLSLADDGEMTFVNQWFPTVPFFDVAIADGVLVAQDMYAPLGYGRLRAYRWQNMEPIGVYPEADDKRPLIGFALGNAQAVLERLVVDSGTVGLSLQGVELANFVPDSKEKTFWDRTLDNSGYDYIVRPTSGFGLMITQPLRSVWRLGRSAAESTRLFGNLQGHFESVHALDAQHAVSLDGQSRHEIDLTSPSAPVVKSSPLLGLQPARLLLGPTNEIEIWTPQASSPVSDFSLASIDGASLSLHGRVKLTGKRQTVSGADVLTADFEAATNRFRIQTFPLSSLRAGVAEQSLQSRGDFWLPGSPQPAGAFRGVMPAVIGADANSLVIAERWEAASDVYLKWLSRSGDDYGANHAEDLTVVGVGLAEQVLVRDRKALIITKFNLVLVEHTDVGLAVRAKRAFEGDSVGLNWTSDFIFVASGSALQGVSPSLELLSPNDLSTVHSFPLDDQGLDLAEVGEHLVVTVRNGFAVMAPPCSSATSSRD